MKATLHEDNKHITSVYIVFICQGYNTVQIGSLDC